MQNKTSSDMRSVPELRQRILHIRTGFTETKDLPGLPVIITVSHILHQLYPVNHFNTTVNNLDIL